MKWNLLILAAGVFLCTACFAQKGMSNAPVRPNSPQVFNDQNNNLATGLNLTQWAGGGQHDYFGGNVIIEGAGIPPEDTVVVFTCGGKERYRTNTDIKGNFFVQSYQDDVTKKQQNTPASFVGCEVTASSPGFDSTTLRVQDGTIRDSPNVGTLRLHRSEAQVAVFFSETSTTAPKDAIAEYNKALNESKLENIEKHFKKAVQIYPGYAQAWYALGKAQQQSDIEGAKTSYAQAVAADPNFVLPYLQLSWIGNQQQNWQAMADNSQHATTLCPKDCPTAWYYNSVGNYNLGNFEAAEKSARQGLAVDGLHSVPGLEQSMAVILAHKQQFPEAADHLRAYLQWAPNSPDAPTVRAQLAQVEKILAQIQQDQGQTQK